MSGQCVSGLRRRTLDPASRLRVPFLTSWLALSALHTRKSTLTGNEHSRSCGCPYTRRRNAPVVFSIENVPSCVGFLDSVRRRVWRRTRRRNKNTNKTVQKCIFRRDLSTLQHVGALWVYCGAWSVHLTLRSHQAVLFSKEISQTLS